MGQISERPVVKTTRQKPSGRRQTITAPTTNTVVLSALFSLENLSTSSWGSCCAFIFLCWRQVSQYKITYEKTTKKMHEIVIRLPIEIVARSIFNTTEILHIREIIQINNTVIFSLLSFITLEYCIVNLIAMSLSKVINIRWRHETYASVVITMTLTFLSVSLLLRPNISNILHRTYDGWPKRPWRQWRQWTVNSICRSYCWIFIVFVGALKTTYIFKCFL